jgi:hypothetical protein
MNADIPGQPGDQRGAGKNRGGLAVRCDQRVELVAAGHTVQPAIRVGGNVRLAGKTGR